MRRDDAVVRVRRAVIVEVRHGKLFRELEQRADVVAVVMRGPQVIDLRDARGAQRLGDASQIAVARIAGVDQQRIARRTDEERRWQLTNDTGATGKGYFVGPGCGLCANAQWKIDSRSLR